MSFHKPVRRQPPAVESNAARSPSRAGQHPHMVRDDREHNPQQMYEGQKVPPAYQQVGQAPQHPADDFWGKMLVLGAGALAAYLIFKPDDRRQNPSEEEEAKEEVIHKVTEKVVQPAQQPTVVVVSPAQQGPHVLATPQVVATPQPVVQTSVDSTKVVDAVVVEDKTSNKRQRKTTQARDEKGHYLPAGTRGRAITEGKD